MALIHQTRLRHLPVYDRDIDQIVGILHSKQALLRPPATREDVRNFARRARFVPEQQRGDALLTELRKTGTTFAIVVDEYGGTAGAVTLEDVVEFMVGDIPGEYEASGEPLIETLGPKHWRLDAQLSVQRWYDLLGPSRNPEQLTAATPAEADTVGGLIMQALGRDAKAGDTLDLGNVRFTVETVDGKRIETVRLQLDPPTSAAEPSELGGEV